MEYTKDKGNTNAKTPIWCKKCISHPVLMIKKMLFQKIKKNSYFSRYMHAQAYVRKWTLRSRI